MTEIGEVSQGKETPVCTYISLVTQPNNAIALLVEINRLFFYLAVTAVTKPDVLLPCVVGFFLSQIWGSVHPCLQTCLILEVDTVIRHSSLPDGGSPLLLLLALPTCPSL